MSKPITTDVVTDVVTVRRRFNDPRTASVRVADLRELRVHNDAGGVCSPLPRPFLHARVWCDHLLDGQSIHSCDAATAPHELELCILEQDNAPLAYAGLTRQLRRQP